ncbi:hypothetical protein E2C01_071991 [Portunus trituberculatus]|uniref:Uncharacterized protein n=1 Tax=Portunus trituberculatus TaxID=210409 RepID=A0A5B7I9W9_PORTR|nr:hypothetical protein [Portunus trituberculatus]
MVLVLFSLVCRSKDNSFCSLFFGARGPVHLANKFGLLSDDSVESSLRSDENSTDLTKVIHIVDVHLPPVSPKLLKGLTKRHRTLRSRSI